MIQTLLMIAMPGSAEWLLIFAVSTFWIYTIYKVSTAEFKQRGQKFTWLLIVILMGIIGVAMYWTIGTKYVLKTNEQQRIQ